MSYSYTSTNHRAATNPLRSMVWNKPAHQVLGWSELQKAEFRLNQARAAVAQLEIRLQGACMLLGQANRLTGKKAWNRRNRQAEAFRAINQARAALRAARRTLVAAELAMLAFADAA